MSIISIRFGLFDRKRVLFVKFDLDLCTGRITLSCLKIFYFMYFHLIYSMTKLICLFVNKLLMNLMSIEEVYHRNLVLSLEGLYSMDSY